MISINDKPALLLIDIQKGFDDIEYWGGQRNNHDAEKNASMLLQLWRARNLPVAHVNHCSLNPISPLREFTDGNKFKDEVKPFGPEPVFKKNVNSAFIGTGLKDWLAAEGISQLVIAGLTTDHCVSTTTRMAGNFGFETYLVSDATATFCRKGIDGQIFSAELIHETALASLSEEFTTVVTTEFIKRTQLSLMDVLW